MIDLIETLKLGKDVLKKEFLSQNKVLSDKSFSLENTLANYENLGKKVVDLNMCLEKFTNGRNNF